MCVLSAPQMEVLLVVLAALWLEAVVALWLEAVVEQWLLVEV